MTTNEVRAQGWYPDDSGVTKFWDGQRWTGDMRPPRSSFAAASANKGWGIGLAVVGVLMVFSSPTQFTQEPTSTTPPVVLFLFSLALGLGLVAWGVYLLRGRGPSTKEVLARLNPEQLAAAGSTPPPAPASNTPPSAVQMNVHSGATGDSAAAAQIQAIANPETAKALQNLQNLLYTHTISNEEFQSAKRKLLGDLPTH